jgi:hypothetical protein
LSDFSKLNGTGNAAKIHHITRSNISNDDVEAWPRNSRETANALSSDPQAVRASNREAFEREIVARPR